MSDRRSFVVLSGGVGGAKLAFGLSKILPPARLTVVANTGDDFEHLGLRISPDLDTLVYTLGNVVNEETGWGCRAETWQFMEALERLGGETWFRLGDRDLATHVRRTQLLTAGVSLSEVTSILCARFGVEQKIVPMSNQDVRTRVHTPAGTLDFQHYFVRDRTEPQVTALDYHGAGSARPAPSVLAALRDPELAGVVVAPSNPYLSIDPILAVGAMREAIDAANVPVVAVSPIVGNAAIKGPTAKIMRELGLEVSAESVARHYGELLDGFIVDSSDTAAIQCIADARPGLVTVAEQTIMSTPDDKIRLAETTVDLVYELARR